MRDKELAGVRERKVYSAGGRHHVRSKPVTEASTAFGQEASYLYQASATHSIMPEDYLPRSLYQHELKSYSSSTSTRSGDQSLRVEQSGPFEPILRRRARIAASTPVRAMSLVGLKHIFFRQTITPSIAKLESRDRYNSDRSTKCDDVESQDTISSSEKATVKKAFKVDARIISDATIGLSDGLTVPFALTAGLSALGNTRVVIYGGLAELIAGAISMGLGGYLGAKSEAASYKATKDEAQRLIVSNPQAVMADISEVFEPYNLPQSTLSDLTSHLADSPKLIDFVMQFQHCSEPPAASRAFTSALTIALGYFLGGLLPLIPYFCVGSDQVYTGLYISIGVMVFALFVFGYVKTCVVIGWQGGRNIRHGCYGGLQMVIIGSFAAGAAMGLVRAFNHNVDVGAI